jgi:hypothetical protein
MQNNDPITLIDVSLTYLLVTVALGEGDTTSILKWAANRLRMKETDIQVSMAPGSNRFWVKPRTGKEELFELAAKGIRT